MIQNYANGIINPMEGRELAALRKQFGLTQVQLAERIGIASNSLARLERGERRISEPIARLVKLLVQIETRERADRDGLHTKKER